jgi:ABC-type glycerol-3-phosphate transport system substrate-binding protein
MVDIEINQTGQYVREPGNEPFAAMNDLLGEDLDSLSIPSATAPWTVRGNIYGVGNEVNPLLMLYRGDVMEELGVDAEAPVSWDEWIEQVGGAVHDSGTALAEFDRGAGSWRELNNVLNAAGGQFFDGDGNVTVLDNDLAVDILTWQKGHVDSGLFLVSDADLWGLMGDSAFVSKYAAPWLQGFMKQNNPDMEGQWRMRHLPKWSPDSPKTSPYGGTGMGITAASENKPESYEFIRVCNITSEGSLLAFRRMNLFPSYTPVWDSEELLRSDDYFGGQIPGQFIAEAAAEMAVVNVDPYWGLFGDIVNRLVMDPVFEADADPRAALEEAIEEFEFSK